MISAEEQLRTLGSEGIEPLGSTPPDSGEILTPEALRFVAKLARRFEPTRQALLRNRLLRHEEINAGKMPDFLAETRELRQSEWKIASAPKDLQDRRVEITGPVDRKMVINALNSGASVYMADFEDAHSPTWEATIAGQVNVRDAIRRTIRFESPDGKKYALNPTIATLMVRPRGWHLDEKHVLVDGERVSGGIFDFALFMVHNAEEQLAR